MTLPTIDPNYGEVTPNLLNAYTKEGNGYFNKKKYKEAIVCYKNALDIKSDDAKACFAKGCALAKLLRYKEAIESYNNALEIDPDYDKAHLNQAHILLRLGTDFYNAENNKSEKITEQDNIVTKLSGEDKSSDSEEL